MSPYIETTNKEKCMGCDKPARFKGVTIPYGVYFAYCKEHLMEMIDLMGLLFVLLIFAPFLFLMVPTLLCYKLTGGWWPKPEAEA